SSPENVNADYPSITSRVGIEGGQEVQTRLTMNYRVGWILDEHGVPKLSDKHIIDLHRDLKKTYREVVLVRRAKDVVINEATARNDALEIFSGPGFADFKQVVAQELQGDPSLVARGILIEDAVVYGNELDPDYTEKIRLKVIAIQEVLQKKEETKAAEEEAKRVFAQSQANVEKVRQDAEAAKIKQIKEAEAAAEQQRLEGFGERQKKEESAKGVLALGLAEAEVEAAKRDAMYAGTAGYRRAFIEMKAREAEMYSGMFRGANLVPESAIVQVLKDAGQTMKLTVPVEGQ
ncbi:MAG: hypothetical protein ACXABY_06140, partial [Candidatus Thorarchaeota archaeon]